MKDNGAKEENVERLEKSPCAEAVWNPVLRLQGAGFSLLLNDLPDIPWTFGAWIYSTRQWCGHVRMTQYLIDLTYTRILLGGEERK